MPTAPSYGGSKVRQQPLPAARKTAAPTPESFGAGLGELGARLGTQLLEARVAREQAHADEIALIDFDTQLANWEHANLNDAETGVLNVVKGKDALGLAERIGGSFDLFSGELAGTLNPRQQAAAQRLRHNRKQTMSRTLEQYAAQERNAYDEAVMVSALENAERLAVTNYQDLARVGEELERGRVVLSSLPTAERAAKQREFETHVHTGVVRQLLASGQDQRARAYFEEVRDQIDAGTLVQLTEVLDVASTEGDALRTSTALWRQYGPKADGDPIQLDVMEDAARERYADNPKALKATIGFLRERKAGLDASRTEREEALVGGLWKAVAEGATLEALRRRPDYLAAPGRLQAQLSDYIVARAEREANRAAAAESRAASAESRAYTREQRAYATQEREGWAMMWHYNRPDILSQMSDNQLLALTPSLGVDHVNRLMANKRELAKGDDTVRAATIDAEAFKAAAHARGLQPYAANLTEDQKARLGRTEDEALRAIGAAQVKAGRALTRGEKDQILSSVLDGDVLLNEWGGDPSYPAVAVSTDDQANAYVPIGSIPGTSLEEFANYLRSTSPAAAKLSTPEIRRRYQSRLERAYAALLMRMGDEAVINRLRGDE